jgi:hypothetical protein
VVAGAQVCASASVQVYKSTYCKVHHCGLYGHLAYSATSLSYPVSLLLFFLFLSCPHPTPTLIKPYCCTAFAVTGSQSHSPL